MAIEAKDENDSGDQVSVEQIFETQSIPSWREQLTVRAFVVSLILGFFFSFIVMKLNLTVGIIPSLNVSAGMLGYFLVSVYTKVLAKFGMLKHPFTRQENTVIQTCVVATSGIAFSGGFGSYLFGMSDIIAKQTEEANTAQNTKTLQLGWIIGFLFAVSFVGLFSVVPLRKIMIIDHKLIYPSGTATAHLINSFHTPQGAKLVKRQVYALFKCFVFSFLWAFFQWFYTAGDDCGFASFPTLGLEAYQNKFYFDFSATYVGVGMICPYIVNISLLAGSVLSWGIMWPLIGAKKGDWYSDKLSASSLHGLQGYKVFIGIAMILGDGLYNFCAMLVKTASDVWMNCLQKEATSVLPLADRPSPNSSVSFDDMRRKELFVKDQIPTKLALLGYALLAVVSIITVPHIFPQLKWYHILVTYIFAPVLAFCNAYGCGLTDWSLASSYGKLAIVLFGAWVGLGNGGVLAGLASCGVMMSIVSTASDLMQDFKTGYLTLASPRAMFISQVIGTAMGCVIGPVVFWIFYKAYNVGVAGSEYPAPYATVYRGIALLGVEGLGSLPKNCVTLCIIFFIAAFLLSAAKDFAKHKKWRVQHFLPSAMAMAIPFFIGSYFSIDMCLGSLILFLWRKFNLRQAEAFAPAVASGMICGEGIWSLPSSILSLAKVKPPICMKFLSRSTNAKVDAFLNG